jgi:hypothetical protein
LFVFTVLGAAFILKRMNRFAHRIIGTVGASLKALVPEAAQLHFALGFVYIPLTVFVTQFATPAGTSRTRSTAGFAIGSATTDFFYGHSTHFLKDSVFV